MNRVKEMEEIIMRFANYGMDLGLFLTPFSALFYPIFRLLERTAGFHYSSIVKGIWYVANGLLTVTEHLQLHVVVACVCFIEAFDHFVKQYDSRHLNKIKRTKGRLRKEKQV
ncbi:MULTISPECIES: hypothetical protein [unclassified Bacillus (in: firmicutes)]|uniref:hypothetical protein n=1 Tax=unclassified Bacillus (in: firmicutes) TaxID=185979 RepID=UPI00047AC02C|nr:hypothetical protein [Bacillus sp. NSP9.1]QHZ46311.1 hypothetical protein M654_008380 [Bacillus sp. NSP9.1]